MHKQAVAYPLLVTVVVVSTGTCRWWLCSLLLALRCLLILCYPYKPLYLERGQWVCTLWCGGSLGLCQVYVHEVAKSSGKISGLFQDTKAALENKPPPDCTWDPTTGRQQGAFLKMPSAPVPLPPLVFLNLVWAPTHPHSHRPNAACSL